MHTYVVNTISNKDGTHLIHRFDCSNLPEYYEIIGEFSTCLPAVEWAKKILPSAQGCNHCSAECIEIKQLTKKQR